mgnify:CR=1 FL=1
MERVSISAILLSSARSRIAVELQNVAAGMGEAVEMLAAAVD